MLRKANRSGSYAFPYGRLSRGSGVWADGKIYIADVNAHFHVLKPGEKKCDELYDHYFASNDGKGFIEINGSPAIVNGRIYMATRNQIFCLGKKDHKSPPDKVTPLAQETPIGKDVAPAVLQAVPADVVLKPGDSVQLAVPRLHRQWPATPRRERDPMVLSDAALASRRQGRAAASEGRDYPGWQTHRR